MFKLPLLQPHLTGGNGVDGKPGAQPSKYSPFLSTSRSQKDAGSDLIPALPAAGRSLAGNVEVYDWQAQGQELTADVLGSDKYKSVALHAEVKLAEALSRCDRLSPSPTISTATGEPQPNKLRTAVCCQLLGEFAELCGPFSNVLRSIRDELVNAVYSSLYSSEQGWLAFDQLPWFSVAERLQTEKDVLLEERERFTAMLLEQQVRSEEQRLRGQQGLATQAVIQRIEQQMDTYQRAALAAQTEAGQLRSKLEALAAGEEIARNEAKTGREELKRLRKEWLRMKDELSELNEAHRKLKEETDKDSGGLRAELQRLQEASEQTRYQLYIAQDQLAASVPLAEHNQLQQELKALQMQLAEAKQQITALEISVQEAEEQLGSSTPRPSWKPLHAFGVQEGAGLSTQELVTAAAEKLAALAAALQSSSDQAAELEMVIVEDPPPAEVHLSIATDTLPYFITEGAGTGEAGVADVADASSTHSKQATVSAEGLGRGPHVPRCLRRHSGRKVTGLQCLSLEATEALVMHIWKCKMEHERLHPSQHLQSYLYTYFSQQWSSNNISASQLSHNHDQQQAQQIQGNGSEQGTSDAAGHTTPGAQHHAVTQQAYTLYHALSCHCRASPMVQLFHQVLSGHLSEGVFKSQALLSTTLLAAAAAAAKQHAGNSTVDAVSDEAIVPTPAMLEALQQLGRHLPPYKLNRLRDAYCTSVNATSTTFGELRQLLQPLCIAVDPSVLAAQAQHRLQQAMASNTLEELESMEKDVAQDEACLSHNEASDPSGHTPGGLVHEETSTASSSAIHGPDLTIKGLSKGSAGTFHRHQQAATTSGGATSYPGLGLPADMTATLGNAFVNMLLQLHLEQHLQLANAAERALSSMPTMPSTATPDPPLDSALGGQVTVAAVRDVLQQVGLNEEHAAQLALASALQIDSVTPSPLSAAAAQAGSSDSSATEAVAKGQCQLLLHAVGSQLTWSGLVTRTLKHEYSHQLLRAGQGYPDMLALLKHTWQLHVQVA